MHEITRNEKIEIMNLPANNTRMRLCVRTPEYTKKIAQFFFSKRDRSLYVSFYFQGSDFYYGQNVFPANSGNIKVDLKEARKSSLSPKISYHVSGEVRFKVNDDMSSVEKLTAAPLDSMTNQQHIVTIDVLSIKDLPELGRRDSGSIIVTSNENTNSLRVIIYASMNKEILLNFPVGFILERKGEFGSDEIKKIYFGIKPAFVSSINNDGSNYKFFVLSGWDKEANDISKSASFMYLVGK